MSRRIAHVSIVVRDYDEAIAYYTTALNFKLVEDTPMGGGKRFVRVAPGSSDPSSGEMCLLLARAANAEQESRIGNQTGGRVFLFLHTDDFDRDYTHMQKHDVRFIEQPRNETYGKVVVFEDLYGNRWDLVEPRAT